MSKWKVYGLNKKHKYAKKLQKMAKRGDLDGVVGVLILHESTCGVYKNSFCDCKANIVIEKMAYGN